MKATLHQGLTHTDKRGMMRFVNEKVPGNYRRFYLITHADTTIIRAWQGHLQEEKAFLCSKWKFYYSNSESCLF